MQTWILLLGQAILAHQITVSVYHLVSGKQTNVALRLLAVNSLFAAIEATLAILTFFILKGSSSEFYCFPYFSSFILIAILVLFLQQEIRTGVTSFQLLSLFRVPTLLFSIVSFLLYIGTIFLCVTTNLVQVKKFSLTSHALLDTVLLGFVSGVLALNRKHFTQFKWDNLIADRGKAIRLLLPLAYLLYYVLFRYLFYKWVGVEKYSILAFYGLNALIAYLIFGYTRGLLLNKNFNEKASEKYKKNKLSLPLQEDYYNRIKSIVQEKALYLNPELSIKDLSQEVGIPAPYVSQVLNTFHEKGYYGFVNEYRIQKVIALLEIAHPDQKVNISDIAMESGFNSMTTFYKFFKEHVGTTPKEFLKRDFAM